MTLLSDCWTCMRSTTNSHRQSIGCGYEPPPPSSLVVRPWRHPAQRGAPPTLCPGYTTRLPEVLEAARYRLHWDKGASIAPPTERMQRAVEVLELAAGDVQAWLFKPKAEGGGGS